MAVEPEQEDTGSTPPRERTRAATAIRNVRALIITATRRLRGPQDRLLRLLGSDVGERDDLVGGMLDRNRSEATSYWLQLVVSVGIATLGLVLGSVAIIIGAMLVAPLMTPIIGLAMGLAAGSPFLVLRSAARIVVSVVVAIGGAATITLLLPFHELTHEIASRTTPTALDLLTAGFCALAGVYASLRPGSDTATTAAGTSIGISLVPPLCASGYGFGTALWPVAGGAALLFLTNLVAIIFVGTISFVAAGFTRVNVTRLERDELTRNQQHVITAAIARRLAGLFESKSGPFLRFLMPLALLAIVYIPLRRALDEVAWQVRARAAVEDSLLREPNKVVQTRIRAEHHQVNVRVVLLGTADDAKESRARLEAEIRAASGVEPRIEVVAIPDATALAGLESTLRDARDPIPALPAEIELSVAQQLDRARSHVRSNVVRLWPADVVGEPLVIEIGTAEAARLRVRVVHLGRALSADGVDSLRRGLGAALERDVELVDAAIPTETLSRSGNDLEFVARVSDAIRTSREIQELSVCVTRPSTPEGARRRADDSERRLADTLAALLASHPRVTTAAGDWSVRLVRGKCPSAGPGDAGAPGTATE